MLGVLVREGAANADSYIEIQAVPVRTVPKIVMTSRRLFLGVRKISFGLSDNEI
jgi:hypothetical protein